MAWLRPCPSAGLYSTPFHGKHTTFYSTMGAGQRDPGRAFEAVDPVRRMSQGPSLARALELSLHLLLMNLFELDDLYSFPCGPFRAKRK